MLGLSLRHLANELDPDASAPVSSVDWSTPDGIVRFATEALNVTLADYQEDILRMIVTYRRIAARAPHGSGKTRCAAIVILWGMYAFPEDTKIITTASNWRQVEKYLWPEVHLLASRANWSLVGAPLRRGKELLDLAIKLSDTKTAFAVASDNPSFIEGAHATNLIYIFDEAKAIPDPIWDAAEGAFSTAGTDTGGRAFALAISTPGDTSGRFYNICTHRPGFEDWKSRHITLAEAIAARRISQEWVNARKKQWGEKSAIYQNRVLGEFDASGEDNVISLAAVEKAQERWHVLGGRGEGLESWGVDPAWKGEDMTALAKLVGRVIELLEVYEKQEPMQTAGRIAARVTPNTPVAVDSIGIGAGIYSRLRELKYAALGVNVSERAVDWRGKPLTDKSGQQLFINLRAYLWWMMREALDPEGDDPIALPPDDDLTGDLTAPTYGYRSDGRIYIESKDAMRERLGRSPDKADAVALALFAALFHPKPLKIW